MSDNRVEDFDLGYLQLSRTLAELGKQGAKAGVLSSASKEVKLKASQNQFGGIATNGGIIPPRPFITQAWDNGAVDEYASLLLGSLEEYIWKQDLSAIERGFTIVGSIAAQDMQDEIKKGDFVENSPQTIAEKKHDKVLQGKTGELLDSIDFEYIEQKKAFKPADTSSSIAKAIVSPSRGAKVSRRKKRRRRTSLRSRIKHGGLSSLAKSPGYQGRGIRKRADKRRKAAKGVVSRGVRRRGLRF